MSRSYRRIPLNVVTVTDSPTTIYTGLASSNVIDEIYLSVYSDDHVDVDFFFPALDVEGEELKITVSVSPDEPAVDVSTGISISGDGTNGAQIRAITSGSDAYVVGYINRLE